MVYGKNDVKIKCGMPFKLDMTACVVLGLSFGEQKLSTECLLSLTRKPVLPVLSWASVLEGDVG